MAADDIQDFMEELNVFSLQSLTEIKRRPDIIGNLRFDVTPRMTMEPLHATGPEGFPKGYMFYVEAYEDPPLLMLMKLTKSGITTTVGKVEEIPVEMLRRAVAEPVEPPTNKMYAITDEIRKWLVETLSL